MKNSPVHTRTAEIILRSDGIVWVAIRPNCVQTTDDARENLEGALQVREGVRRPILVDISQCTPLTAEVRQIYSGAKLGEGFGALAIQIHPSAFGRIVGNIYLRIAKPGVPIQLFNDFDEALYWLLKFVK